MASLRLRICTLSLRLLPPLSVCLRASWATRRSAISTLVPAVSSTRTSFVLVSSFFFLGRPTGTYMHHIDETIKKGELGKNETIAKTFKRAIDGNGRLHLAVRILTRGLIEEVMN